MAHSDRLALPAPAPGTDRHLVVHRFGTSGARPKVWLQAALHADELPGVLVLQQLMTLLDAAERAGTLRGEIAVVPIANPIGLAQNVGGHLVGRFALDGAGNFNRGFVDLRATLAEAAKNRLTDDARANVSLIRGEILRLLHAHAAFEDSEVLKLTLQRGAADADIALDLHCDLQAPLHLYIMPHHAVAFEELAARLAAAAVLTATDSGDVPFDESLTGPWWHLIRSSPDKPIPPDACLAATVELRGERDIDDATAAHDAAALFAWLQSRGAIAGTPPASPPPLCAPTPLEGVDVVRAPAAGLWLPAVEPGARVAAGDAVGTVVGIGDPVPDARTVLRSRVAGVLFARMMPGLVRPGDRVAKIAGSEPLPDRKGKLLGD
ncbi:MAG: succinylglutamate desuccinylase/aspartoacylase family protein [Alphaproteobacteria bacterium]|nr:succinylglutamate desuccinylase/aspartoacylase family protein [Alphaproteobacteria bacterium]